MIKIAELSEEDVKSAIEYWMFIKYKATIINHSNITFFQDPSKIYAKVQYIDTIDVKE